MADRELGLLGRNVDMQMGARKAQFDHNRAELGRMGNPEIPIERLMREGARDIQERNRFGHLGAQRGRAAGLLDALNRRESAAMDSEAAQQAAIKRSVEESAALAASRGVSAPITDADRARDKRIRMGLYQKQRDDRVAKAAKRGLFLSESDDPGKRARGNAILASLNIHVPQPAAGSAPNTMSWDTMSSIADREAQKVFMATGGDDRAALETRRDTFTSLLAMNREASEASRQDRLFGLQERSAGIEERLGLHKMKTEDERLAMEKKQMDIAERFKNRELTPKEEAGLRNAESLRRLGDTDPRYAALADKAYDQIMKDVEARQLKELEKSDPEAAKKLVAEREAADKAALEVRINKAIEKLTPAVPDEQREYIRKQLRATPSLLDGLGV